MLITAMIKKSDNMVVEAVLGVHNDDDGFKDAISLIANGNIGIKYVVEKEKVDVCIDMLNNHPVLSVRYAQTNRLNVVSIYDVICKAGGVIVDGLPEKVQNVIVTQTVFKDVTLETATKICKACQMFYEYMKNDVTITCNVSPENLVDVSLIQRLDSINKKASVAQSGIKPLSFMENKKNLTLKMNKATDEVFIAFPLYASIATDEYNLPNRDLVLPPLKTPEYGTPDYKTIASLTDLPYIEGIPSNNKLGIQDNEKRYYDAIIEYIDYCIAQEFDGKSPKELTLTEYWDSNVMAYLKNLAIRYCAFNWNHTGLVPDYAQEVEDKNFSISGEEQDKVTVKYYKPTENNMLGYGVREGDTLLKEYIDTSVIGVQEGRIDEQTMHPNAPYRIADILVKLLRWGVRKPTKICIEDFNTDFVLYNFKVVASKDSFNDGVAYTPNGREFIYKNPIYSCGRVEDITYLNNLGIRLGMLNAPIGIMCIKESLANSNPNGKYEYEGNRYESKLEQRVYMSLVDVIEILDENPNAIEGITRDENGNYVVADIPNVDESLNIWKVCAKIFGDTESEDVIYTSTYVKNHALSINATLFNTGYLTILEYFIKDKDCGKNISQLSYMSKAECADIVVKTGRKIEDIMMANIASTLLPPVLKALSICEDEGESSVEFALRETAIALLKEEIDLSLDDMVVKKSNKIDNSKALQKLNLGGKPKAVEEKKEEVAPNQTPKREMNWFMESKPAYQFFPVVKPSKTEKDETGAKKLEIVFLYTKVGNTLLLTSPLEPVGIKVYDINNGLVKSKAELAKYSPLRLNTIMKMMSRDLLHVAIHNYDKCQIRFTSTQVLSEISSAIAK